MVHGDNYITTGGFLRRRGAARLTRDGGDRDRWPLMDIPAIRVSPTKNTRTVDNNCSYVCWSPLAVSGAEAARLARGVAAQADLREARAAADNDGTSPTALNT
ncbi:hypothetical protein EVAR_63708_1 [Eumeta japonica]|uniref:Uncharacterized protein n=1 Tax=Eumeta variegata TaxID=151549 RepID=A0A4C1ZYF7_EUMVA|nr:hypothetical protein EVAR_63708_1 [Eumeta japonica]